MKIFGASFGGLRRQRVDYHSESSHQVSWATGLTIGYGNFFLPWISCMPPTQWGWLIFCYQIATMTTSSSHWFPWITLRFCIFYANFCIAPGVPPVVPWWEWIWTTLCIRWKLLSWAGALNWNQPLHPSYVCSRDTMWLSPFLWQCTPETPCGVHWNTRIKSDPWFMVDGDLRPLNIEAHNNHWQSPQ